MSHKVHTNRVVVSQRLLLKISNMQSKKNTEGALLLRVVVYFWIESIHTREH